MKKLKQNLYWVGVIGLLVFVLTLGIIGNMTNIDEKASQQPPVASEVILSVEEEVRMIAERENFQYTDYLVKLAECESGLDPLIRGDSGLSRGLFQINSYYWPDVSDECAFNVECSTLWTMEKINEGKQGLWTCNEIINEGL